MDPGYAMLALDDATHGIHLSLGSMVRDPLSIQAVRDAHSTIRSHGVHLQYICTQGIHHDLEMCRYTCHLEMGHVGLTTTHL